VKVPTGNFDGPFPLKIVHSAWIKARFPATMGNLPIFAIAKGVQGEMPGKRKN